MFGYGRLSVRYTLCMYPYASSAESLACALSFDVHVGAGARYFVDDVSLRLFLDR